MFDARPALPQDDGAARAQANDVEGGLSDIDPDYGDCGLLHCLHAPWRWLASGSRANLRLTRRRRCEMRRSDG
jgi:hypothetical protein